MRNKVDIDEVKELLKELELEYTICGYCSANENINKQLIMKISLVDNKIVYNVKHNRSVYIFDTLENAVEMYNNFK
jgi:hypothetical protein